MKNLLRKSFVWGLLLCLCLGMMPAIDSNAAGKSIVYTALGDSLTDYATYDGKSWTSYPYYVAGELEKNGTYSVNVKNDAVGGYTTEDLISQLKTNSSMINDVRYADAITVVIGGNDFNTAMATALIEAGCDLGILNGVNRISANSREFKALYEALGNKNNSIHAKYITGVGNRISEIVSLVEKYNANCKIGISINGYNEKTGINCISTVFNMDESAATVMAQAVKASVREMQAFYADIAQKDARVYYIDIDEMFNTEYMQRDTSGKVVDPHPNYVGQLKLTELFINDFWNPIGFVTAGSYGTGNQLTERFSFAPVSSSIYSASNISLGTINKLTVDEKGVGAKAYGNSTVSTRMFNLDWKPAKDAGVVTGFSMWDSNNTTEILLRFEGTNTTNIKVCVGGNGKYVTKSISLGFDASLTDHNFGIKYDDNAVSVFVDKKLKANVNISGVASPGKEVTPIFFTETASWTGTFAKRRAISTFGNIDFEKSGENLFEYVAENSTNYSQNNASLGTINTLSVDTHGIGAKAHGSKTISASKVSFDWKPAKASGVISGFSMWDDSNSSEILVRFEGINTKYLKVCAGGNGKYVNKSISLEFDASSAEHNYCIEYSGNNVVVTVDGKKLATVDTSSVIMPIGNVTPIIFVETASWVGTFDNRKATGLFSNFK